MIIVSIDSRMHRFRSKHTIHRLRLAVFVLLFLRYVLIPAFFIILIRAFLVQHPEQAVIALILLPVIGLFALWEYFLSARTNCPLCTTPVLGHRSCNKHTKAQRRFFSYKLRVALAILFTNSFRCPYCNEPSALEVRQRRDRPRRP